MGTPLRGLAVAVVIGLVALTGCSNDPTYSSEYALVVAERDAAQVRLDAISEELNTVLSELDQVRNQLAEVQRAGNDTTSDGQNIDSDEASADPPDQGEGSTAELALQIDQEVERVCSEILDSSSGETVAEAASMISFDDAWEPLTTPADVESRVTTCAGFDYLTAIALGAEFGDSDSIVRKWVNDIRISVVGSPTPADLEGLDSPIADLNRLIDPISVLQVASGPAELAVHFIPAAEFEQVLPQYVPGNEGFFWIFWNAANEMTRGTILVRTDGLDQIHRNHVMREELTQALGLSNDSFKYEDSIFQQAWTGTNSYAAIDEVIIALLYRPEVLPGMLEDELRIVLDWRLSG